MPEIKMKPIIFNTEMVKAILDGRKTVTRRILKTNKYIPSDAEFGYSAYTPDGHISVRGHFDNNEYGESFIKLPYRKGDILYVRETWARGYIETSDIVYENDEWFEDSYHSSRDSFLYSISQYFYRADFTQSEELELCMIWRPSIHMPKEAARIFLRVKNVRVERLRDITDNDCKKEGIVAFSKDGRLYKYAPADEDGDYPIWKWHDTPTTPQEAMQRVWDSTIKKTGLDRYGWDANPWVWVIEFERIDKSEVCDGGRKIL